MKDLQERYKNDRQKLGQEMMAFIQETECAIQLGYVSANSWLKCHFLLVSFLH